MAPKSEDKAADEAAAKEVFKEKVYKSLCLQFYLAVVAHTINLQSEAILIRNACGNDLGKAARISSISNAVSGVVGMLMNQIGGKLSDGIGRKPFYLLGPIIQMITGLAVLAKPSNLAVLAIFKALKVAATTFSGTVIGGSGMRDIFTPDELKIKNAKVGSVVGLAIMTGPILEAILLKRIKAGREHLTYLGLVMLGGIAALTSVPESLNVANRKSIDLSSILKSANPFGFVKLYTEGSAAVKKLVTIITLQTVIDGKNISDLVQIWTREHLKLQMTTIRNFVMGYGFASMMTGVTLTPYLLKNMSVAGFTKFTNFTNFVAFSLRGSVESMWMFFGCLPIMLPGVNATSASALIPVLNEHMTACGFGIGESTAWANNLRALVSAMATVMYGYFYAWCRKNGFNAGLTFALAGAFGAALPQALLTLFVNESELDIKRLKAKN